MSEKKLQGKLVTKTTLTASLIMILLSTGIIYLLLFIEKKTGDWPVEVWGVIYLILFSMFGLYYIILHYKVVSLSHLALTKLAPVINNTVTCI